MARSADSTPTSSASAWKRYVLVGGVLLVLVVVAVAVFWPRIQFQLRIGELHSDSPEVAKAARDRLTNDDDPDLNDRLYGVLTDPDTSFVVRLQVGGVLVNRNRLNLVERALRSAAPEERTASLAVLYAQSAHHGPEWFRRSYAESGEFPILETLEAWLKREGDASRRDGVNLAAALDLNELVPLIRPIVRAGAAGELAPNELGTLKAAAKALVEFGDCETMSEIVELASTAEDDLLRLRMMQALHTAAAAPER